ncbi:hypothetical protein BDQ17DRAFT_1368501 [Cyathus striatus]|nr:hypothetical protein BDQ17DRAFT_1379582 [Cyathus striatus]KAF8993296.1 hypothetical protein BDQ17DRAFT_1368501 [Cyathus striatus]
MQFSKLSSAFALVFLVVVTTAMPNPEPQYGYVICPGSGDKCSTNGYHCCGLIPTLQYCLPVGSVC